jgi:plastocyanin
MRVHSIAGWAAGILGALALSACGSPSATSHNDVPARAMTRPTIVENTQGDDPDAFYRPDPIRVRVGQTVTWTNKDSDPHDVTSVDGVFASGPIAEDASFRWTPTRPGTYRYFCTLHPEMHGEIIVRAAS